MTKTQDYKGQIRSKRLGGTGVTEDQVRQMYGRKGKFFVGLIEVEVDETHEKKDGNRKVDLLLNQVWLVTDEEGDLEPHLRQLMRTLHQNKVLKSDQDALDIEMKDDLEPSVDAVIAAQRAHAAGEPHVFDPAEDGDDCIVCGEELEHALHEVEDPDAESDEPVDDLASEHELEPAAT